MKQNSAPEPERYTLAAFCACVQSSGGVWGEEGEKQTLTFESLLGRSYSHTAAIGFQLTFGVEAVRLKWNATSMSSWDRRRIIKRLIDFHESRTWKKPSPKQEVCIESLLKLFEFSNDQMLLPSWHDSVPFFSGTFQQCNTELLITTALKTQRWFFEQSSRQECHRPSDT